MNRRIKVGLGIGMVGWCAMMSQAAIVVPGANGSDGALVVTTNITIDLSQATTGVWSNNNSARAGKGTYDSNKWAVVFKYTSVSVASNCTVTFANHPSRAPVVWLVSGNVTIDGTVSLNGQDWQSAPYLAEPGPGGFRGGMGGYTEEVINSAGFGLGGGQVQGPGYDWWWRGTGGSYGTQGSDWVSPPPLYGNASLIPLIGGSGGGGEYYEGYGNCGGGAGGGAILIACIGILNVSGQIVADGGVGAYHWSGGGSGGGIRLVSDSLIGAGGIFARGGSTGSSYDLPGGDGRIRIERVTDAGTLLPFPSPSIKPLSTGEIALIWPPTNAPSVRIVSVGGVAASTDPRASFGTSDVAIPETDSTAIIVETVNVEAASQVQIRLTPRHSANYSLTNATVFVTNSLNPLTLRWRANPEVGSGYSAVQVRVVRP